MADTKISALSAVTAALAAQEIPVNDAGTTKKMTVTQLLTFLQAVNGLPLVKSLTSAYTNATTSATKVTGLDLTLAVGTYIVKYHLMIQNATAANACNMSVNFTGTATGKVMYLYHDSGTTAVTPAIADTGAAGTIAGAAQATNFSAAATQMTVTAFVNAATNAYMEVTAIVVVTVGGNVELWAKSESTTSAQISVGSSVIATRTN
jgi:hypothetical protein